MQAIRSSIERDRLYDIALIPAGVALNIAIAITVSALKLPLFLDSIGTIAVVLMARQTGRQGMWAGMFVGVSSFVLTALFFNPTVIWFCHVQAAIAVYAFYVIRPVVRKIEARHVSALFKWSSLIACGIGLGLVTGLLSAPVIAILFSGVTPNGPGAVNAILIATGKSLYTAVIAGGISIEPVDKTLQTLLAVSIYLGSPWRRRADSFTTGN